MVQLRDYSDLRRGGEDVEVPLNGVIYMAMAEPPADALLDSVGQVSDAQALATALDGVDITDEKSLRAAVGADPILAVRLGVNGMSQTERAIRFVQTVLLPGHVERFARNMAPPDPEWDAETRAAYDREKIILPQVLGVYKSLQEHYSGHPTEASSSSPDGDGATGPTSTAGAQAAG